jgi:hypothetical protein
MGRKTTAAWIYDLRETVDHEGHTFLVLEFREGELDGKQVGVKIPDDAADWEEFVPALVEALAQRGYKFAGEPTGDAGPVELVHL